MEIQNRDNFFFQFNRENAIRLEKYMYLFIIHFS